MHYQTYKILLDDVMNILQTKYFRPRKIHNERYIDNAYQVVSEDIDYSCIPDSRPYTRLLGSMLASVDFDDKVIDKKHLGDFIQCQDYHPVEFNKKSNQFYVSEVCYFHPEYEVFVVSAQDLNNEYGKIIFDLGLLRVNNIYYNTTSHESLAKLQSFFDKYVHKYVSDASTITLLLKDSHDLMFKKQSIKPYKLDLSLMYNDTFLPVHHKIQQELSQSKKGVVLLHGLAGTGKTNYIKWLTAQVPDKDFVFVPNNMIGELAKPEFMSQLIRRKNSILVLEDCENYIAERAGGGNQSDVVGVILNIADGILSDVLECQFICTFNADLMDIDHALLRRGRLIAQYHFDKLSVDKCNAYLQSIGKHHKIDEPMTLSQLVHIDEEEFKDEDKKGNFGFV